MHSGKCVRISLHVCLRLSVRRNLLEVAVDPTQGVIVCLERHSVLRSRHSECWEVRSRLWWCWHWLVQGAPTWRDPYWSRSPFHRQGTLWGRVDRWLPHKHPHFGQRQTHRVREHHPLQSRTPSFAHWRGRVGGWGGWWRWGFACPGWYRGMKKDLVWLVVCVHRGTLLCRRSVRVSSRLGWLGVWVTQSLECMCQLHVWGKLWLWPPWGNTPWHSPGDTTWCQILDQSHWADNWKLSHH